MPRLLSLLLALLAACSPGAAPAREPGTGKRGQVTPAPAAEGPLAVATFNINFGNVDLDETARVILETDADVVALQEVNSEAERALRASLAERYPFVFVGREQRTRYLADGSALFSKIALEAPAYLEREVGIFGTLAAVVRFGGHEIQLINVHLTPMLIREGDRALELMRRFGEMEDTHLRELEEILAARPQDRLPTIFLGDFNSLPNGELLRELRDRGLADSAAALSGELNLRPTWSWILSGIPISLRLDHILHSEQLEAVTQKIHPTSSSDHALLVSELAWAPSAH